jgi:hypothetical protein
VPILFGKHRADRRQCDFRRGADGIGREAVSKKNPGQEVAANSSESSTIGRDRRVGLAGITSEQPTPADKA